MKPESNSSSLFDRVRAWALGLASEREVEALRGELERDRDAAGFADDYRQIHEPTRALHADAASSRLEFAALEALIDADERARRTQLWRRVAAAAVVVVLAGAAWWLFARRASSDEPLRLSAIPLALANADLTREEFPQQLTSYVPVENGEIRWIDDLASGEAMARASGRPVLVFGMFPTCPWCQQMKAEGLRDPTVLALVEDFVPVQINLYDVSDEVRDSMIARGYPLFEVWNEAGDVVHAFPGVHDAPAFVDNLVAGVDKAGNPRQAPAWADVQRQAREYSAALIAEDAGQLGLAERTFAAVDRAGSSSGLARAARRGIERIAVDARATLLAARALAQRDTRGAERDLVDAARRFEGSSYAADLEAARERLARDGRFPELSAAAE